MVPQNWMLTLGVITIVFMYLVKKIVHPALEVHIGGLAATHEGIDNCSILSRVMIATEQIILVLPKFGVISYVGTFSK